MGRKGEKYWWLNDESLTMLERGYLLENETPEMAISRVTKKAASYIPLKDAEEKFKELIEKGWMSLSSPVWANMGADRGLPISCHGSYVPDSLEGIVDTLSEVLTQTKTGGGTSAYFGDVRPRGSKITGNGQSNGAVSFLPLFDVGTTVTSQGGVRRGAFAAYLDIDHGDIAEFLDIKDIGNKIQNIFYAVNVPDYWMQEMIDGDKEKRKIWAKVLESRKNKGLPYIHFIDTVNKNKPQVYIDKNYKIVASNLCNEISLPSSELESFVCCLASMNLELYEEWKDTDAVTYGIYFLDAVMQDFIDKTANMKHMERSHRFAKNHRALGLGVMGYHAFLQKNMIPFESMEAKLWNTQIFKNLQAKAIKASENLAKLLGESPVCEGTGRRNTTLLAIAPTTSSSAILGQTSPGIEPYSSNYYKVGLAKGNFMRKNKFLKEVLASKNEDTDETWKSILVKDGSVQHLDFLSDKEKDVFKTFRELSQLEIIIQAATRQKYICQSQSLNLNIPPNAEPKDINALYIKAWELGVKGLYYQRSASVSQDMIRNIVSCASCEA